MVRKFTLPMSFSLCFIIKMFRIENIWGFIIFCVHMNCNNIDPDSHAFFNFQIRTRNPVQVIFNEIDKSFLQIKTKKWQLIFIRHIHSFCSGPFCKSIWSTVPGPIYPVKKCFHRVFFRKVLSFSMVNGYYSTAVCKP